jgi:hypothetical protein
MKISMKQTVKTHRVMSFPHCLDNRLKDGGEVVRFARRPSYTPVRFMVLISVRTQ